MTEIWILITSLGFGLAGYFCGQQSLKKEAARYLWLRTRIPGDVLEDLTGQWPCSTSECDRAIDEAMAKELQ